MLLFHVVNFFVQTSFPSYSGANIISHLDRRDETFYKEVRECLQLSRIVHCAIVISNYLWNDLKVIKYN